MILEEVDEEALPVADGEKVAHHDEQIEDVGAHRVFGNSTHVYEENESVDQRQHVVPRMHLYCDGGCFFRGKSTTNLFTQSITIRYLLVQIKFHHYIV